jgi:hypothetical protein
MLRIAEQERIDLTVSWDDKREADRAWERMLDATPAIKEHFDRFVRPAFPAPQGRKANPFDRVAPSVPLHPAPAAAPYRTSR